MSRFGPPPGEPARAGEDAPRRASEALFWPVVHEARVGLVGLPDELGVRMNGGRPGAARGPAAFRQALARYGAAAPAVLAWPARGGAPVGGTASEEGGAAADDAAPADGAASGGSGWPRVYDFGDIIPGDTLEETHHIVSAQAALIARNRLVPVAIGGGHDLTFAFVRGAMWGWTLSEHHADRDEWDELVPPLGPKWSGIYLDAHLDVRSEVGSGMPFRRLVEECRVGSLHVRGLDPFANSQEHLDWFRAHGGKTEGFGPDDPWPAGPLFMSIDLDVLDQGVAPGVSAMNPSGWSVAEAAAWARAAGRSGAVKVFDIMELSPPNDEGGRTARVAARLFLEFLAGMSERSWDEFWDELPWREVLE